MKLSIVAPDSVSWTVIDTETPRQPWDSPNRGTSMIALEAVAPQSGELTLAVIATPGSCAKSDRPNLMLKPLTEWEAAGSE